MSKGNLGKSLMTVGSTVAGGMASRIIEKAIPMKKDKDGNVPLKKQALKHGLLAGVSIAATIFLDRSEQTQSFVQDLAIGFAVVQSNELIKKLVKEPKGNLKTALGNPFEPDFLASYNDFDGDYDFIPLGPIDTGYTEEPYQQIEFRS